MTAALEIRPIVPDDRPAWGDLWRAYLDFYETTLPETVYDTTFGRLLSPDHPDQNGLIALLDGRAVGLVHYIYHAHNWRVEQVCYLQDLYAAPEARGIGIGRALIEAVYACADADGRPAVYWMTQEFNTTARQLYDRIATVTPFIKYSR
ncbi:Acetyltransferase [Roseovarius mucosus DSM 17069]|uniref:Acetyltransferase n=1 Tax=Roseovarius mucosus DSM 17069 TaxID=1288298 RepID=A0A0A0HTE9_9RHOB|nr:GNAT family N-acetyltransferase [Roseovarius mucosus]KGM89844.1 Acetyltransferase [Roseovarius mucosus DSM 17069]